MVRSVRQTQCWREEGKLEIVTRLLLGIQIVSYSQNKNVYDLAVKPCTWFTSRLCFRLSTAVSCQKSQRHNSHNC
jgi:hypothetical protein